MGQVCSGASEEAPKRGLLDAPTEDDHDENEAPREDESPEKGSSAGTNTTSNNDTSAADSAQQQQESEASKTMADLERRKRRELWIVNEAARGMVAVRSTRGSTGYYDQGFAGLLAQHLEQTTSFPDKLPLVLPPPAAPATPKSSPSKGSPSKESSSAKSSVYARLTAPAYDDMELVVHGSKSQFRGREASAAASGDPHKLMDALAESLLDGPYTVLPAKQQLFAGVKPIVENLW